MKGPLKKCALRASALCVCLVFGAAMAQEGEQIHGPIPGVEAAVDYQPPEEEAPPAAEAVQPEPERAEEIPTPVVDEVAQTDIPAKAPPKPERVKPQKAPREPLGLDGLRAGARAAFGLGGLGGHAPLVDPRNEDYAIVLKPNISFGLGLSVSYNVLDFLDAVVDVQYVYYKARNEYVINVEDQLYRDMFVGGAVLHALEFPIFARVHAEPFIDLPLYAEAGFSIGANIYSYLYTGEGVLGKPIPNYCAGGLLLGVGYEVDEDLLVGLRTNYVITRYAKNVHGRPWALRADLTYYFVSF